MSDVMYLPAWNPEFSTENDLVKKTIRSDVETTIGFQTMSNDSDARRGVESIGVKFVDNSQLGIADMKLFIQVDSIELDVDIEATIRRGS